jgi:hypothetical protein
MMECKNHKPQYSRAHNGNVWLTENCGSLQLPSMKREDHTARLGKNQNSEFEVQFILNVYGFCPTVSSNNYNSKV